MKNAHLILALAALAAWFFTRTPAGVTISLVWPGACGHCNLVAAISVGRGADVTQAGSSNAAGWLTGATLRKPAAECCASPESSMRAPALA